MGRRRKLFGGRIPGTGDYETRLYAVCVFGPKEGRPVEIACRSPSTKTKLTRADDAILHYNVWVEAGAHAARAIRSEAHRLLDKAGKRIDNKHFDIDVKWAKKVIAVAATKNRVRIFTTADISKMLAERDRLKDMEPSDVPAWCRAIGDRETFSRKPLKLVDE
jgi:hypothetical protein